MSAHEQLLELGSRLRKAAFRKFVRAFYSQHFGSTSKAQACELPFAQACAEVEKQARRPMLRRLQGVGICPLQMSQSSQQLQCRLGK